MTGAAKPQTEATPPGQLDEDPPGGEERETCSPFAVDLTTTKLSAITGRPGSPPPPHLRVTRTTKTSSITACRQTEAGGSHSPGGIVYGTGSLEPTSDELFSYMVMTKEELDKVMPHLSILKDGSKSRIFHEFSQFQQVAKRELRRSQSNNDDKHNNLLVDDEEKFLVKFNTKLGNLISHVSNNILPKVKKPAFFSANFRDRMEDGLLVEISSNITKARNMLSDLITDYDNLECAKAFKSKSNQINI